MGGIDFEVSRMQFMLPLLTLITRARGWRGKGVERGGKNMEKETMHVKEGAEERVGLGKETGGDERGRGAARGRVGRGGGTDQFRQKALKGQTLQWLLEIPEQNVSWANYPIDWLAEAWRKKNMPCGKGNFFLSFFFLLYQRDCMSSFGFVKLMKLVSGNF